MAGGSGHNSTMKHQKSTPRFGPLSDRVNNASSQNSRVLNSTPKGSESRFIQARSALFEERAIAFQPKPASPDTEKSATRLGYPPREDSHRDLNAALGSYSAYLPLIEEKSPPASPALADKGTTLRPPPTSSEAQYLSTRLLYVDRTAVTKSEHSSTVFGMGQNHPVSGHGGRRSREVARGAELPGRVGDEDTPPFSAIESAPPVPIRNPARYLGTPEEERATTTPGRWQQNQARQRNGAGSSATPTRHPSMFAGRNYAQQNWSDIEEVVSSNRENVRQARGRVNERRDMSRATYEHGPNIRRSLNLDRGGNNTMNTGFTTSQRYNNTRMREKGATEDSDYSQDSINESTQNNDGATHQNCTSARDNRFGLGYNTSRRLDLNHDDKSTMNIGIGSGQGYSTLAQKKVFSAESRNGYAAKHRLEISSGGYDSSGGRAGEPKLGSSGVTAIGLGIKAGASKPPEYRQNLKALKKVLSDPNDNLECPCYFPSHRHWKPNATDARGIEAASDPEAIDVAATTEAVQIVAHAGLRADARGAIVRGVTTEEVIVSSSGVKFDVFDPALQPKPLRLVSKPSAAAVAAAAPSSMSNINVQPFNNHQSSVTRKSIDNLIDQLLEENYRGQAETFNSINSRELARSLSIRSSIQSSAAASRNAPLGIGADGAAQQIRPLRVPSSLHNSVLEPEIPDLHPSSSQIAYGHRTVDEEGQRSSAAQVPGASDRRGIFYFTDGERKSIHRAVHDQPQPHGCARHSTCIECYNLEYSYFENKALPASMTPEERNKIISSNRSLRNVKNELEALLETGALDYDKYDTIMNALPAESSLGGASRTTETTSTVPAASLSKLSLNNPSSQPASNDVSPPPLPGRNAQSKPEIARAKAIYKYNAPGDCGLEPGDDLAVYEYMNSEWWLGKNLRTGQEGVFPANYVYIPNDLPPARAEPSNHSSQGAYAESEKSSNSYSGGYHDQSQQYQAPLQPPQYQTPAQPGPSNPYNSAVPPMQVAEAPVENTPNKGAAMGKKFGKKLGNAAIFGAGATLGSDLVNSIF